MASDCNLFQSHLMLGRLKYSCCAGDIFSIAALTSGGRLDFKLLNKANVPAVFKFKPGKALSVPLGIALSVPVGVG
ncbi:MAG: hypothetical protein ACK56I_03260, partial [bacterium]